MKTEVSDRIERPGLLSYVLVLILTSWTGCFAVGFGLAVPQFKELLAGFGADVPTLTKFVINHRVSIWVLLFIASVVQLTFCVLLVAAKTMFARRAAFISLACNIAVQLILVVAMYLPIFKLGEVV